MADETNNAASKTDDRTVHFTDLKDMQVTTKPVSETKQEVSLNSDDLTLDQWVDAVFAEDEKNIQQLDEESKKDYRPTIDLGRFGLKTPEDVKTFLHSPAGEVIIGEMRAQEAQEEAVIKQQQFEQRERELAMKRIKSIIFLCYVQSKARAAHKVRDAILEQNEKAIAKAKTQPAETSTSAASQDNTISSINATLENYSEVLKEIQIKEEMLDEKMAKLENEGVHIEVKYGVYEANLETFEQEVGDGQELSKEDLETRLNDLKDKMDEYTDEVHQLLAEGKDDDARILLHTLVGLNLQAASLHDMLAVRNQEKHMVDELGNPTESIQKAKFVLNREQHVVMHNGEPHLVTAHKGSTKEDLENLLKNNSAVKEAAFKAFADLKNDPHAMSVKQVVQHNKGLEKSAHNQAVSEISALKQDNQAQKLQINNEISQLSAMKGEYLKQVSQTDDTPAVTTTPSPAPKPATAPTPKPSSVASAADSFRKGLAELKEKQADKISRKDLFDLAEKAPGKNKIVAKAYLQMEFIKNMPRFGGGIPHQTMQSMLQNLERFGVDSTKESMTSITNPFDKKNLNEDTANKQDSTSPVFSPTPFNTKPQ